MLTNRRLAVLAGANLFASNPPARALLATPRHERHAFPTLAAAMLTAIAGGCRLSGHGFAGGGHHPGCRKSKADVVCSASRQLRPETLEEIITWPQAASQRRSLAGGPPQLPLEQATAGSRWLVLHDFSALEHQLAALGGRF